MYELSDSSDSDIDSDERDNPGSSRGAKKRKIHTSSGKCRDQKYRSQWESEFKWLKPVNDNPRQGQCSACSRVLRANIGVIKRHGEGAKHQQNVKNIQCQLNLRDFIKKNATDSKVKRAELKLCGFLAEHNIAFLANDHLVPLLQDCFPDSNILKNNEFCDLVNTLKKVKFSILVDESTDIAAIKTMAICVRYYCESQKAVKTSFLSLMQVFSKEDSEGAHQGATAEKVYNEIVGFFKKQNIPLENVIGFGSDGCNVMFGANNSVVSRLRIDFPGIFTSKCICHSLHLCASEACKVLPRETEAMARDIYTFFNHSSKRQAQFDKVAVIGTGCKQDKKNNGGL
ncbi:unnamed protein product [Ceutorhynchus assimilis]|uniref:DUF4371 domain-containing protein n=1 Tax=Ceutorhynchus assimilis TaxID=467358 RepID=A0A9N9QSZ3_9CUCU|nr:unnamed protein product [Ceutorhynchus assimilis]